MLFAKGLRMMQSINLPPFAPILMESTRAIGYSLETAIADIVDNSIAAGASNVSIEFFPVDREYISILDNGTGMDGEQLTTAMQYGSKDPTEIRKTTDLGRFGLGLKTASLSQCRILTVISKCETKIEGRQWDLDYVIETGEWSLKVLSEEEMSDFPQYEKLMSQKTGTLVVWQNLDRMKIGEINFEKSMSKKMEDVRQHLSLVYHRFLGGERGCKKLEITLNNVKVEPRDPFLKNKSERPMSDETLNVYGNKVIVRPYILPHISRMTVEEQEELGGAEGLRKKQGFYIYRGGRLVIWGTWFKMARQGELSKLVRVQVDIPNSLDDLWTLDIKKSAATPPEEVKNNLRSVVDKLIKTGKRTYTFRGKKETSDAVQHIWNRLSTQNGGVLYEINRDHPVVHQLMKELNNHKIETLLKQIENGLPLNALYIDLTNDVKIDNEKETKRQEILDCVKSILEKIPQGVQETYIYALIKSEPFDAYADQILESFEAGKLS